MLKIEIKKTSQYFYDEENGYPFKLYLQEFIKREDGGYELTTETEGAGTVLEPVAEYVEGHIELISDCVFKYKNGNLYGCRLSSKKEFNEEKRSLLANIMEVTDWNQPLLRSDNLRLGDTVSIIIEDGYSFNQEILEDCKIIRLGLEPMIEYKGEVVRYLELVPSRGNMWINRISCKKQKTVKTKSKKTKNNF